MEVEGLCPPPILQPCTGIPAALWEEEPHSPKVTPNRGFGL